MTKMEKLKVLFICKDNSVRSQMAAAFLNRYFGDHYEAYSAGLEPSEINPYTKKVMEEIGIDISSNCAKSIEEYRGKKFDCIISLCDYAAASSSRFPECKKKLNNYFKGYCTPIFCEIAEKSDACFPEHKKLRGKINKGPSDVKDTEKEILAAFRCLREEIFDWIEKEAMF